MVMEHDTTSASIWDNKIGLSKIEELVAFNWGWDIFAVQEAAIWPDLLWNNPQEGNYFLYIYQLDRKYPRIQCGKDINSIGRIM